MSLQEIKVIDQIMVSENGTVLYREATRVLKDEKEIACTYHRTTLYPGQDLSGEPEKVVAIARTAWTPEVVAAYRTAPKSESQAS